MIHSFYVKIQMNMNKLAGLSLKNDDVSGQSEFHVNGDRENLIAKTYNWSVLCGYRPILLLIHRMRHP